MVCPIGREARNTLLSKTTAAQTRNTRTRMNYFLPRRATFSDVAAAEMQADITR